MFKQELFCEATSNSSLWSHLLSGSQCTARDIVPCLFFLLSIDNYFLPQWSHWSEWKHHLYNWFTTCLQINYLSSYWFRKISYCLLLAVEWQALGSGICFWPEGITGCWSCDLCLEGTPIWFNTLLLPSSNFYKFWKHFYLALGSTNHLAGPSLNEPSI